MTRRDVYVHGTGIIPFGRQPERTLESLAVAPAREALLRSGLEPAEVDAVYCGNVYGGMLPGHRVAAKLGLTRRPIFNVEAACSSSAAALHLAVSAVRAGQVDTALVVGVEQLSRNGGGTLPLNGDDPDVRLGLSMPVVYAMRAQRYLAETPATVEDLAAVAVKNRSNGADSPIAQFRALPTIDDVLGSRMVADPLTLLQCCGTGDGAAAVVVSASQPAILAPIRVAASQVTSGSVGAHDLEREPLTARLAAEAYREAGLGAGDLDVIELHDAFSIAELLYYEALGLCGFGEAADLLASGITARDGEQPVNAGGGLLARGHPLGATGVAQVVEVVRQMREADPSVRSPKVGLTHCTGGGITGYDHAVCSIHVLAATGA